MYLGVGKTDSWLYDLPELLDSVNRLWFTVDSTSPLLQVAPGVRAEAG